jgi:two-component system cell cycle sensor histidine kinase/response regulator CckA
MADDDALLANVIDDLPLGVWIARAPAGEFVLANRMFREIMGMEARPDVVAGGYAAPYGICTRDGEPYPEHLMPFARAVRARATTTVDDIVIHRSDGGRVNIRATARPVMTDAGVITHVVIAFADITAEVAAEKAGKDAEERLRAAQRLEALGRLAAGVAHDFNNLLASIRMLASLLALREPDASRRDDLQRIEDATESAAQLSRALLAFGRHGGARVQLDLVPLVAGVVDLVRRTFDRNIAIDLAQDARAAPVDGDRGQLEQLLMNLLVNARDAMPAGGRIGVRVGASEREVVIEVSDTGPGIPSALKPRIFEPYFTTKRGPEGPGTGLGLATVYGVVQAHGGTIEVLDAEPRGARFRVVLPRAARRAETPGTKESTGLRRREGTVLLVDDDVDVRSAMARALTELGYTVIEAGDGIEALEIARRDHPRLTAVLLDTVMPRMGGRETFAELRALAPDLPVLMTTGRAAPDEVAELIALGVDGFLPKPFDVAALSRALGVILDAD